MDKRLGLAIVVSVAILWAWWKLFPPPQPATPANPPNRARPTNPLRRASGARKGGA